MSADRWSVCPQCLRTGEAKAEQLRKRAMASYGVVPREQFQRLTGAATGAFRSIRRDIQTLREDWDIGTTDTGRFYLHYEAHCETCGFSVEVDDEKQILPELTP